jgi:hypothetical protein
MHNEIRRLVKFGEVANVLGRHRRHYKFALFSEATFIFKFEFAA